MDSGALDQVGGREWLVEQRYRAVLEVLDGCPVSEVAVRYGVARQSVYTWRDKYAAAGLDGLRERSRRPKTMPTRISAEVEALICQLRRAHPRWGARRISFELGRDGCPGPVPSRVTVHRVLVRNGLVKAQQQQQHRRKYKRWQREAPMHLWQLDLVGGLFLTGGRECKLLTGIDDHSRFVVAATVLAVPSGRAVADAFMAAMRTYGVPSEVLTDNGKQFTGRFTKPRPAEVLFERLCRENGITARLTRPYSPTTTGKIERWHRTLRRELLDVVGTFADIPAAQAAIDAWVHTYNHDRPHQALDMASPAKVFRPNDSRPIGALALPAVDPLQVPAPEPVSVLPKPSAPLLVYSSAPGVEFDTIINTSGMLNVIPRVQRIKMGKERAGQRAHVWADELNVHIVIDGQLVKTTASNLDADHLAELRMRGATPAGPPPVGAQSVAAKDPAAVIDVKRRVNIDGIADVAKTQVKIGREWANQDVTLRIDDHLIHVIRDGRIVKTLPCTIPAQRRHSIRGAMAATAELPPAALGPVSVRRRVPDCGRVMVTRQKLTIGTTHAGKIVTIFVEDTHFRVTYDGEELSLHPRREQRPVTRWREKLG